MMDEHKRMVREGLRFVGEQAVRYAKLSQQLQQVSLKLGASKQEVERLRVALMHAEAQRVEEKDDNPETGGPLGIEWGDLKEHKGLDTQDALREHLESGIAELRAELAKLTESRRGLYARIDGLEAERDEAIARKQSFDDLYHERERECVELRRKVADKDAIIDRLEDDKAALRTAHNNTCTELGVLADKYFQGRKASGYGDAAGPDTSTGGTA